MAVFKDILSAKEESDGDSDYTYGFPLEKTILKNIAERNESGL